MEQLRRYVSLATKKKDLDAAIKEVKAAIDELEPDVLAYMQANGIQNIKVDDHLIFIRKDIRATFLKTEEAFAIISEQGLDDALVTTINPQKASAICREFINDIDVERPAWLDKAFSILEDYSAAVRKG